jgi:hypothetical protein
MPTPNKVRVRTEEQLARKRLADRINHKVRRGKEKGRVERLEAEIESLRGELEILRRERQESREETATPNENDIASPSVMAAERAPSPLLARYIDEERSGSDSVNHSTSPTLPRTELLQLIKANYTPEVMREGVENVGTPSRWPLIVICSCGIEHKTKSECLEYATYRILLRAHVAISNGSLAFAHLPRTPSLANLLLHSTDDNPVVAALSDMFKQFETSSMPVLFGLYILLYRLLRVCQATVFFFFFLVS